MTEFINYLRELFRLPVLASETGVGVNQLVTFIHLLMIALFIGWFIYFAYTLWRFNQRRNPRGDYQGVKNHASSYIEVTVAGIEALLLIFVAIPVWARNVDAFPKESEATVVHVAAQQFAWNARYAGPDGVFGKQAMELVAADNPFGVDHSDPKSKDDVQVLNEIHVPVNKPVIAHISSKDVIHSFKVLTMRVGQDAIPGMRVPIWFTPNKEGRHQIYCAQLCGNGHAAMAAGVIVVENQKAYEEWLAAKTGGATVFE
jgi:cytochrome c oxidase subunit II